MKITSVDVILVTPKTVPISRPVLCRVNTDAGISGYGEAGATFNLGSDAVYSMLKEMAPKIIGMDPMQNEVIWQKLYETSYWTKGNGAILFSAVSAIDIAIWDIKGKAVNKPLYELLGGAFQKKLRCYASQLQFGMEGRLKPKYTLDEYREVTKTAIDKGYTAIKVDLLKYGEKPGERLDIGEDYGHLSHRTLKILEDRMRVIRETAGDDCDIILEQHCGSTLNTAVQIAKTVEPFNIMYIEEPLAPLNPDLTAELHRRTNVPLTTGERSYLRQGFMPFFKDHSLDMIQPDLGLCGGITEGKKICDMAYAYDIGVQLHVCDSAISIAAGVHLECSIPNFTIHEMHVLDLVPEFLSYSNWDYTPVDGYITVPEGPGLGVEPSEELFKCPKIETIA